MFLLGWGIHVFLMDRVSRAGWIERGENLGNCDEPVWQYQASPQIYQMFCWKVTTQRFIGDVPGPPTIVDVFLWLQVLYLNHHCHFQKWDPI